MQRFKDLPIRKKIVVLLGSTTIIALVLSASFLASNAWVNEQQAAADELETIARLIGANSTAALVFNDTVAAQEILDTLDTHEDVIYAALFDEQGQRLAYFERGTAVITPLDTATTIDPITRSDGRRVTTVQPVVLGNEPVGSVMLQSTLSSRMVHIRRDILISISALAIAFGIAILIALRLSRSITTPLRQLSSMVQHVSTAADYTVRANILQGDEVGTLARGFNDMLNRIEQRDKELEQHRISLEEQVAQRTSALQDVNEKLKAELNEREKAEYRLKHAHQSLEEHHQYISLLSEMNERLQICHSLDEIKPVVAHYMKRLFHGLPGVLFVYNNSRSLVESLVAWGEVVPEEQVFHQNDCWALRQGRPHTVNDPATDLVCAHIDKDSDYRYACIPMIAYGDVMGMLHMHLPSSDNLPIEGHDVYQQRLVSASEHLALALANLKLREALQLQSVRDPLTGLFNRRYMQETLERELARSLRANEKLAVLMLDIDHFKSFNDTHGHEAGDMVLVQFSGYLKESIRTEDIACRYGGEEFLVIMPGADQEVAVDRSELLRQGIKSIQLTHKGKSLSAISISIGVAVAPVHSRNVGDLIDAADAALYNAKRSGRDRVAVASEHEADNVPIE